MMKKRSTTKHTAKRRSQKRRSKKTKRRTTKKPTKFNVALSKLKRMKQAQQVQAVRMSNNAFIRQLSNHVKHLRYAPLSPALKKKLQRQKTKLRKLVNARTSTQVRRKMLTQRGGFLPLLLAALPAVGSLVGNIISGSMRN